MNLSKRGENSMREHGPGVGTPRGRSGRVRLRLSVCLTGLGWRPSEGVRPEVRGDGRPRYLVQRFPRADPSHKAEGN
jgi:hypothetical protein